MLPTGWYASDHDERATPSRGGRSAANDAAQRDNSTCDRGEPGLVWQSVGTSRAVEPEPESRNVGYLERIHGVAGSDASVALSGLTTLLHRARHDLRMQTQGPVNVAVAHGMVFDYFDGIRRIIELAKEELLFVDPYLNAEF